MMKKSFKKKQTLLRYWTTRYFVTLLTGLLIVSIISLIWIRQSNFNQRVENMGNMAELVAYQVSGEQFERPVQLPKNQPIEPFGEHYLYQVDEDGEILYRSSTTAPLLSFSQSFLEGEKRFERFSTNDKSYIAVTREIQIKGELSGYVVVLEEEFGFFRWRDEYSFMLVLIGVVSLFGWGVVYGLTRTLSNPIRQVAEASKSIAKGQYEVDLPTEKPQQEVNELIQSFQTMAHRLEKLEKLRNELLAGVTHELKTPITSISGLLQAVKDGVVTDKEKDIFLKDALDETERMKIMVSDLLELNSFATSDVPLALQTVPFFEELENFVYSFMKANGANVQFELKKIGEDALVSIDVNRLKQVIANILVNALAAIPDTNGQVRVCLKTNKGKALIFVEDNGKGIPEDDQHFIFERFYRGLNQKYKYRGMGIGLYFSRILMQAMKGSVDLLESNPGRTIFIIQLPMIDTLEDRKSQ